MASHKLEQAPAEPPVAPIFSLSMFHALALDRKNCSARAASRRGHSTGGFTPARIRQFEGLRVPADLYGVGSWLLSNSDESGTNTDFTADVVRVRIEGRWYDLAKVGRKACDNLMLERVQ